LKVYKNQTTQGTQKLFYL